MKTYVVLIRGLNVGRRRIAMADLCRLVQEDGRFVQVRSVLNTGNLLLRTDETADGVRTSLEGVLARQFREPVPVAVRTPASMARAASRNPFVPDAGEVVYIGFLVEPANPERLAVLGEGLPDTDDRLGVGDGVVYFLYRHGVHSSPLSNALIERRLGVGVTSRNISTVERLAAGFEPAET